jgi:hypothetical protein
MDDDKFARHTSDVIPSSSKQDGPEGVHIIGYAQCCRIWPISWAGPATNMTRCGLCGKRPDLLPMDKWPAAKSLLAGSSSANTK